MKNKYFFYLSPFIAFILYLTMTSSSGGITGYSVTGCSNGTTGCHGAASATTVLNITGLPAAGYTNGTVYSITVSVTNASITPVGGFGLRDGFDLSATAGSFTSVTGTALNGATEIRHAGAKVPTAGTASWTFNWTAPATGTATVTFRLAGNPTNGDGIANAADQWKLYTTTLIKAPAMTAGATFTPILCNGGVSTITASSTNGTAPIQYKLNAGAYSTSNTFTNVAAGTYTITAKDAVNATATTLVTINQPTLISVGAPSYTTPLCAGGTGSIQISSSGGTGTKTYTISPLGPQSNTTGTFTGLTAQTYTITVTDANACTQTTTATMTQPTSILLGTPTVTAPPCAGGTGSIQLTATGGTGTKTYSITPLPQSNTTGIFTGLTAQFYTITVADANNCSVVTSVSVSSPAAIAFISPSLTNPVCNGGTNGAIQIIATGGTGTKFYSINPLGPQTNASGTFSNLSAQTYTINVVDANSCSLATTATLTQPAPVVATSSNVSGCQGTPISLIGSPSGGTFSVANPYVGPSTTYTYSYTNGLGCVGVSSPSNITVTPVSGTSIVTAASSAFCETLTQVAGSNLYSNSSCELITSITASGLGATDACVNFMTGTPSWNGEPYANRVYSISPATQPSTTATVCLYYTPADFAAAGIASNSDISITKVGGNGILGGGGAVSEILNTSMSINAVAPGVVEVCFPVTSFSSFYLHSTNPNNVVLPVSIQNFQGQKVNDVDVLSWTTSSENNNDYFNIQHSKDGIHFETIGRLNSKSRDGNSDVELNYSFTNKNPFNEMNYYRLEQVDIDGQIQYSTLISLIRDENEMLVEIYPNPSKGNVTITSVVQMQIQVNDLNGKQIFESTESFNTELHLEHAGIYIVKMVSKNGQQVIRKLIIE